MKKMLVAIFLLLPSPALAAEIVLLQDGKSDYQIVIPEKMPTTALSECMQQTARLMQTAFQANGAEIAVVAEDQRDAAKSSIFLGDTAFARQQGIDTGKLKGWSYIQRVVGNDVLIVGRDHASRGVAENPRRPNWDRVGTAKGVVDFLRQYAGVRFLYTDLPGYTPISAASKIDLRNSPAIEYLKLKSMVVPADLNLQKTPPLRVNSSHPAGGGFYDLAQHRFPRVDEVFGGHTWERAVPPEKYYDSHPEYFALLSGVRQKPEGGRAQYCLSNPDVQELIYKDVAHWLENGYDVTDLGQPDGFRECQCEKCDKLYDTGKDWGEKIWIFNRRLAERLEKSHPQGEVTMMSYILTAAPPKTFKKFPSNTSIMLTGTNEEDLAPWRSYEVPQGFTGYIYNWCPNLGSRYTPMRTPWFVEAQAKRLVANRIQSIYRDGPGLLFGLEGPVYYVMGRMFDDAEQNSAKVLFPEFVDAAFGNTAFYMRSFYEQLYHAIALYSDHIGTRCDIWTYKPIEGRPRKTVTDPFQLIAFLYTPSLLASLDDDLTQAEKLAKDAKVKTRLALVRTEFEYLRNLARVVHLYHAYQMTPDAGARDRLLDAIDHRNAAVNSLYDKRSNPMLERGWSHVMFPFNGHDAKHLRLAHDGYQEPYANTCLNWDTQSMRTAPTPGKKQVVVKPVQGVITLDSPQWKPVPSQELTLIPPLHKLPKKSGFKLLYDEAQLYILAECELESDSVKDFPAMGRDRPLNNQEAFDVYFAPLAGRDTYYRFMVGANVASQYDAAGGFIADVMDPRHGKDDPTWNGEWKYESRILSDRHLWQGLITLPFQTLGVKSPTAGIKWRGNFARYHLLPRNKLDRAIWSSTISSSNMDDRTLFGEIEFE